MPWRPLLTLWRKFIFIGLEAGGDRSQRASVGDLFRESSCDGEDKAQYLAWGRFKERVILESEIGPALRLQGNSQDRRQLTCRQGCWCLRVSLPAAHLWGRGRTNYVHKEMRSLSWEGRGEVLQP
jgi:hypothetical protein